MNDPASEESVATTDRGPAPGASARKGWDGYQADALDWEEVRPLFARHLPSALGRRTLEELAPRPDREARAALARARELVGLLAADDGPRLDPGEDPIPELRLAARYGRALEGRTLSAVRRVGNACEALSAWGAARRDAAPACAALFERPPDLVALRQTLDAAIGPQGDLLDDASARLAGLRREVASLTERIEGTVRGLLRDQGVRNALAPGQSSQLHRRGGRVCLAVRTRNAGQVPGVVHDRSQSGETLFVEPRAVVELSNRLAALESDERREVQRLLTELTRAVLERRAAVEDAAARLGELELALASARYARDVDGCVPRLPGEPGAARGLLLRRARHPLLVEQEREGRLGRVVPIDLRLGDDFDLLIVTGPNTGGKTLALKTAGLAALCTRLGLAFPCEEGTTVPLYDAVAADVGDEQEIAQNLSTFSSHLARVQAALARVGPRSLMLLDELGGGTDPVEGAALSDALLEHLLERGVATIATTHLGKLKEFAFRHPRAENAHAEFDLRTLAPLYTLVIGAPGESRALAIARRLGFPASILAAAEARLERRDADAERLMRDLRGARLEAERVRARADERLRGVEAEQALVAERAAAVEERRGQLEAEAQRGLEERLARVRALVPRIEGLLPQLSKAPRAELEALLAALSDAHADALMTDRRADFLAGLKKGSLVWVPRWKKRCQVTRIHREERRLQVKLGKQTLDLAFDDVTFYETL